MRTILLLLLFLAAQQSPFAHPKSSSLETSASSSFIDHSLSLDTITCPPSITLNTGPFTCNALYNYEVLSTGDAPLQLQGLPSGAFFPLGQTLNTFQVADSIGNTASCSFTVTVRDLWPPIASCDESTIVLIGVDDPADCYGPAGLNGQPPALDDCYFGGVSWVKAAAFDDNSYDNCSEMAFTIERLQPFSSFLLGLNPLNSHLPCDDPFADNPSELSQAIAVNDSIKFYAAEVGSTQSVLLSIYQLAADGSIDLDTTGAQIKSECTIQVKVEDRLKPVCTPPAHLSISCEMFDPSFLSLENAQVLDNCCLDASKVYLGQCGLSHTVNYSLFDTVCNRGTITRVFRAHDCSGNTSTCTQRIVVGYDQNYFVKFPNDTIVSLCNTSGYYGQPSFFKEDCELMGLSYEDQIFPLPLPDACVQIERIWSVINWCTYNPNLPLTQVPNPRLSSNTTDPISSAGPIVSACDASAPWNPTISKIFATDTVETNFCDFWSANSNGYRYTQYIKIADLTPPAVANCPALPLEFADLSVNDSAYWNTVFNPNFPAQNLAETAVDLTITASDSCYGGNLAIRFLLFLDLDGNGQPESVINSGNLPPANTVFYDNILAPNYIGGTARSFDGRAVPQNEKWRFALQETLSGNSRTAAVRWNSAVAPNVYMTPELPVGTHRIEWYVEDGCGNESTCAYTFEVRSSSLECAPPAIVVVSCEAFDPLFSSYGSPLFSGDCPVVTEDVSVDYSDFDTLCTKGTIIRNFTALDSCGNASQCSQQIVVNYAQNYFVKFPDDVFSLNCDNLGNYGEPTFFGEDCELLAVSYYDENIDPFPIACIRIFRVWSVINWCTYDPNLSLIYVPNPNPSAIFSNPSNFPGPIVSACGTPAPWAATVVKVMPGDPTPTDYCSFWNANANGYQYKQSIRIEDSSNPIFADCPASEEDITDDSPNDPELWNNVFNPNAPAKDLREGPVTLTTSASDECSGINVNIDYLLFLDLDADGTQETVVNSVTLGVGGLGWNNVLYNNINTPGYLGGTPTAFDQRAVPTAQKWGFSIQEAVVGPNKTATVRWNTALSPITQVAPELPNGRHKIRWDVTDGCGNIATCEHVFMVGDSILVGTETLENQEFTLFQNEPNPFENSTVIRFHLPESTPATFSVFDVEGRILYQKTADYGQGMHAIALQRDQLPSSGVLFYQLEAGKQVAWRKMVIY